MKILMNNLSLETSLFTDFASSLLSTITFIKVIEKDYDIYVDKSYVSNFEKQNRELFENTALSVFTLFKTKINDLENIDLSSLEAKSIFYISTNCLNNINVSSSILAYAFQKQKSKENVLIINMTENEYSLRNFIPLFLNNSIQYDYQNIPCRDTSQIQEIELYVYCKCNILPLLDDKHKEKIDEIITIYVQELPILKKVWKLTFEVNNRIQTLFPMQKVTNKILQYVDYKGNSAKIEQLAAIITEINGWEKDEDRSKINFKKKGGRRDVYKPKNSYQGAILYISVDTEKGDFEVHNEKQTNNHLGAISFDCQKYEKPKGHKMEHP
jgi:hypothetical protein